MPFLSRTRFMAEKLLETPHLLFSFLVALGSELLQFPPLSAYGFWLFRPKPHSAQCSLWLIRPRLHVLGCGCQASGQLNFYWILQAQRLGRLGHGYRSRSSHGVSWGISRKAWGISCKACSFCKCAGRLAKFEVCTPSGLQSENFLKHHRSKVHQNAVKMFLANGNVLECDLNMHCA